MGNITDYLIFIILAVSIPIEKKSFNTPSKLMHQKENNIEMVDFTNATPFGKCRASSFELHS
jgi:hypothetical protein